MSRLGSLFFMCLICSRNLRDRVRLVWPMYALLQVLHFSLYMPLLLWLGVIPWFLGLVCCCILFVLLNAILMSVFLKRLVIFLTLGLRYVKMASFLFLSCVFVHVGFVLSISAGWDDWMCS